MDWPIAMESYDDTHRAYGIFSRSNYWIYNSFAMKLQMTELQGWWIFKSWNPIQASYLEITDSGFSYNEPFQPFGGRGSASCSNCKEAYAFLGEVYGPTTFTNNWTIGGYFKVIYNQETRTFQR